MAEPKRVQLAYLAVALILGVFALILFVPPLTEPAGTDVTNKTITRSARLPVFLWCLAWWAMMLFGEAYSTFWRIIWTIGCFACLLHIAVAFHLGHGWSHEAAWEHTQQIGGYGDGVYVNYAFALVWLADVIWVWVAFYSYRTRPRWLHWAIHGFLVFIVFNAAVVFGSWLSRWNFFVWFALYPIVVLLLIRCLRRKTAREAKSELPSPQ